MAVGVVRPRAVVPPAGAWRRNRLTALERPTDVTVGGWGARVRTSPGGSGVGSRSGARTAVGTPSRAVRRRRGSRRAGPYESAVEAPVPDGEQPELRERDGAVRPPEAAFERRREGRGQGSHRRGRGVRLERDEQKRQGEDPQHGAGPELRLGRLLVKCRCHRRERISVAPGAAPEPRSPSRVARVKQRA